MNRGECIGGPMNGRNGYSRYPKGFLLVDKANAEAWLYDWQPDHNVFKVRNEQPMEALTEGPKNRYRAAEEGNYDVVAWAGDR